jgi:hypothetical protein
MIDNKKIRNMDGARRGSDVAKRSEIFPVAYYALRISFHETAKSHRNFGKQPENRFQNMKHILTLVSLRNFIYIIWHSESSSTESEPLHNLNSTAIFSRRSTV